MLFLVCIVAQCCTVQCSTMIGNIKIIADTTLDNEYNEQQFSCVIGHYNYSH